MANNVTVVHKPGGYEAYKDQVPIRKPQWKMIGLIFGSVFGCGFIVALVILIPQLFRLMQSPTSAPEIAPEITEDVTPAINSQISQPLPTVTPSHIPTETITPENTRDYLQMTMEYVSNELHALQTQNAIATPTPISTLAPEITEVIVISTATPAPGPEYLGYAVVNVNNAIVRASSGQNYTALDTVFRGQSFGILSFYGDWVQIDHPQHDSAWVARWLLRVDNEN